MEKIVNNETSYRIEEKFRCNVTNISNWLHFGGDLTLNQSICSKYSRLLLL
jgi:hypothetical protein